MEGFACAERAMSGQPSGPASILDHFSALSDPRQQWRVVYPLPEILLVVLCATLSGMEDFVEIRLWGGQRLDFLRRFLPYDRGLPSHRSEEHTSELQSLMRISYAVFCLQKKYNNNTH